MAQLEINNDVLTVKMTKIWTLKHELSVPLTHITSVSIDPNFQLTWKRSLGKWYGTNAPHLYFGGYFHLDGDKVFYDLRQGATALIIEMKDEPYQKLIIGVNDAEKEKNAIEKSLP